MASFRRTDYGANPHAGANRNNASSRGWGPGWPSCQSSKMATAAAGGIRLSVRREVVDLVVTLIECGVARGYRFKVGQCWGFACRPIRGSRMSSNHAWGLAVDFNSLANPMQSAFKSDIPPAVVADWEACGWYWGGRYGNRPDAMHFERLGRPEDVARDLAKARAILAQLRGAPVPPPAPAWEPRVDAKPGARVIGPLSVGTDVAAVQALLKVTPADGMFGPATKAAVAAYQRANGLPADGVVGPKSWVPLLRDLAKTPPPAPHDPCPTVPAVPEETP